MCQTRFRTHSFVPLLLILALGIAGPLFAGKGGKGRAKARDLQYEDINPRSETHGEMLSLSDLYAEKGVVLQFVASWCKFCRDEMPQLQGFYASGRAPMVFVAADEGPRTDNILIVAERAQLTMPLLFVPAEEAENVSRRYPYEVLPATYFIDARGKIRGSHQGEMPTSRLAQEVQALLGL